MDRIRVLAITLAILFFSSAQAFTPARPRVTLENEVRDAKLTGRLLLCIESKSISPLSKDEEFRVWVFDLLESNDSGGFSVTFERTPEQCLVLEPDKVLRGEHFGMFTLFIGEVAKISLSIKCNLSRSRCLVMTGGLMSTERQQ